PGLTVSADPAWSADGTKIAFDNQGAISVMNANGSGRQEITTESFNIQPDWSPDGTKIVFVIGSGDIAVVNTDGSGLVNITNTPGSSEQDPSWSPNGSKIAFSSNRDGNWEVYVSNPDGSSPTNLTNNAVSDDAADWSPDSTKLVFHRGGGIFTMNADGSAQTQIAADGSMPVWSPDGTKILFVRISSNITTMSATGSGQTFITSGYQPSWQSSAPGTINGTVYESPSGFYRGVSVVLHPLELKTTTSVSDGSFSFTNVPLGNYTLNVGACSYYGCYGTIPVAHSSTKTYIAIYPTPNTPTPTPVAVGGVTQLTGTTPASGNGGVWAPLLIGCPGAAALGLARLLRLRRHPRRA
ncbi:MAG: hypothetical protein ACREMY_21280, partial [bacterium]